jgi:hypothetical protein
MVGVEILNTYTYMEDCLSPQLIIWATIVGAIILFAFALYIDGGLDYTVLLTVLGAALGCLIGMVLSLPFGPNIEATRHEVTLTEEVNINDFLSKYEIIDQRGNILVIEERGTENG